jgi:hypothetical protein
MEEEESALGSLQKSTIHNRHSSISARYAAGRKTAWRFTVQKSAMQIAAERLSGSWIFGGAGDKGGF